MKKSKKVLFNKNNILIEEYNGEKNDMNYVSYHIDYSNTSYCNPNHYSDTGYYKYVEEKTRYESPLGFYYYVTTHKKVPTEKQKKILETTKTAILYKSFEIYGPNYHYLIRYPHAYNNTNISEDTRPWDLVDKNGLEDHFIIDLKNELDKLFAVTYKDKINLVENHKNYWWQTNKEEQYSKKSIGEFKCEIYKDIFGFKDGPKMQSNQEKILSHGFDLKESFRKPKEN